MEKLAQTMTAKVLHHRTALGFGEFLNGMANIARCIARFDGFDAEHERVIGDLREALGAAVDLSHGIHTRGVAVPTVNNDCDIYIDNIAVFERLGVRNAVADHMVDRCANRMLIAAIAQTGGQRAIIYNKVKSGLIQRGGVDARLDHRDKHIQTLSRQTARLTHTLKIFRAVQLYRPVPQVRCVFCVNIVHTPRYNRADLMALVILDDSWQMKAMTEKLVTVGIILIGDELLSGRTQDTNLGTIARWLTPLGVQVGEARIVSDDAATIRETVKSFAARFDYVFTTGGIGPTHDDITADCIAAAWTRY